MTFQQKYSQNKRLLQSYANYLEECTSLDDKIKLSTEIGRLSQQNKRIDKMPLEDTRRDINDYTIQVNALL